MAGTYSSTGTILVGEAVVTTAGIAEPLGATQLLVRALVLKGKAGNTGQVYIGGAGVDNSVNDGIDAQEIVEFGTYAHEYDLSTIYIDADTNGEGVDVYATI